MNVVRWNREHSSGWQFTAVLARQQFVKIASLGIVLAPELARGTTRTVISRALCATFEAGHPCKSLAVTGTMRCRMHGGGAGSGALPGNKNAAKHGLRSRDAIKERQVQRADAAIASAYHRNRMT
jgi:hypothetical protein